MDMIQCPHCMTRVVPSSNGECPSCRKSLDAPANLAAKVEVPPWMSELPEGEVETEAVTIARFVDPVAASLAKNCLEDAGIKAFLADNRTVSVFWQLSNLLGGIKLQVAEPNAARAVTVLEEQHHRPAEEDAELVQEAIATKPVLGDGDDDLAPEDGHEDEPELEPTGRESDAERAFRGAVYGLLFAPLQFYASFLLMVILCSSEALTGRARRRAYVAAVINTFHVMILLGFWSIMTGGALAVAIR
jgi:hypothetical protein